MYEDVDIGHDLKMAFEDGYVAGIEDTRQKWISINEKQPPKAGWYQAFCEGHDHPEYLYFRGNKWAASNHYHKILYWANAMPLPKE